MNGLRIPTPGRDDDVWLYQLLRSFALSPFMTPNVFSERMRLDEAEASLTLTISSGDMDDPLVQHDVTVIPGGQENVRYAYSLSEAAIAVIFPDERAANVARARAMDVATFSSRAAQPFPIEQWEWDAATLLGLVTGVTATAPTLTIQVATWRNDPVLPSLGLAAAAAHSDAFVVLREDGAEPVHHTAYVFAVSSATEVADTVPQIDYIAGDLAARGAHPHAGLDAVLVWAATPPIEEQLRATLSDGDAGSAAYLWTTNGTQLPLSWTRGAPAPPGGASQQLTRPIWAHGLSSFDYRVPWPPLGRDDPPTGGVAALRPMLA